LSESRQNGDSRITILRMRLYGHEFQQKNFAQRREEVFIVVVYSVGIEPVLEQLSN
jgi:hypothetical protein